MRDGLTSEQRSRLSAHFGHDYARLIEGFDDLRKKWNIECATDLPLETAYFVGSTHHLTAMMELGNNDRLLREVLAHLALIEKNMIAHVLKSLRWPWLGRGIAKRMARVRRNQYLTGLSDDDQFVDTRELAGPLAQRAFPHVKFERSPALLEGINDTVEAYLATLADFYEDLLPERHRR